MRDQLHALMYLFQPSLSHNYLVMCMLIKQFVHFFNFQVIYMAGWRPHPSQQGAKKRGSATVSFEDIHKVFGNPSTQYLLYPLKVESHIGDMYQIKYTICTRVFFATYRFRYSDDNQDFFNNRPQSKLRLCTMRNDQMLLWFTI